MAENGDKPDKTLHYGTTLSMESIKVIAESIGVAVLAGEQLVEI